MTDNDIEHIKTLIHEGRRRLQKLEIQATRKGNDAEPHLLTEIEDIRITLKNLQKKLAADIHSLQTGIPISTLTLTTTFEQIQILSDKLMTLLVELARSEVEALKIISEEIHAINKDIQNEHELLILVNKFTFRHNDDLMILKIQGAQLIVGLMVGFILFPFELISIILTITLISAFIYPIIHQRFFSKNIE